MRIPLLIAADDNQTPFPDISLALKEPDGLLAIGANLRPERLLHAYSHGIFPWYSQNDPILWWSPDPRMILTPESLHLSRSLKKAIRQQPFELTCNLAFAQVIEACSEPRTNQPGTWITADMKAAYIQLHQLGYAHSFEAWQNGKLVAGLYGIGLGKVFFGESMFSRTSNASKICFAWAVDQMSAHGVRLIDCQVKTDHLQSLGAFEIRREEFAKLLRKYIIHIEPVSYSVI